AVPVHERLQVEAVDDRVLVPEVGDHVRGALRGWILRNVPGHVRVARNSNAPRFVYRDGDLVSYRLGGRGGSGRDAVLHAYASTTYALPAPATRRLATAARRLANA